MPYIIKPKKTKKEPKQPKLKLPKPPKEPKQPEEEKPLTPEEFVDNLLSEKMKLYYKKVEETMELKAIIDALKSKNKCEEILNERRALVSKLHNKLQKKDISDEDKKAYYETQKSNINNFDKVFNITSNDLLQCDFRV